MTPPDLIIAHFEQISSIPRGTKQEGKIRDWLAAWAGNRNLQSRTDLTGNLAIYVPASQGRELDPVLILQGHLDMVWQKAPDSTHDFTKDPIRIIRDGDWIKADRTTLGADNGIAIAFMMSLVEDQCVSHPPLEILLTVEEELGLFGADNLDPTLITGKTLINLDSEEEGVFTIGCAGGGSVYIHLPVAWETPPPEGTGFCVNLQGLLGGHSGVDIHKHRANANKLLARALEHLLGDIPMQLVSFKGGTARNAIPREAQALVIFPGRFSGICRDKLNAFAAQLYNEYQGIEANLSLSLEDTEAPQRAVSVQDTRKILLLLMALPHGVCEMSAEVEGFVETSNNLGVVDTLEDGLHITSNHRSSLPSRLEEISRRVEAVAQLAGAATERTKYSPPWKPDPESAILKRCLRVYKDCFGATPKVGLSHGGLECGILRDRCGGLDVISLGPTIQNPHSPDERLYIPSLHKTWDFLVQLLGPV